MTSINARRIGRAGGFTLIEILIVVVMLGILAAIVLPQFISAADETREESLNAILSRVRQQLEIYKEQHRGEYPRLEQFEQQLTMASNSNGDTAAIGTAGYPFGPYLYNMPRNPMTDGTDIGIGEPGTSAWYYNEETGAFHPNDSEETRQW